MSFQDPTFVGNTHEFQVKRTNLFAVLDQAEKDLESKIKKTMPTNVQDILHSGGVVRSRSGHSRTRQFRGKDSLFVKPEIPPLRILVKHQAPDFKLHPHKWTKYSLADVNEMNDKSNAAAACAFLKEMETRKGQGDEDNDGNGETKKILFKRVVKPKEQLKEPDSKAIFKSSKLVMPEYEFGKKVQKKKNRPESKPDETTSSNKQITLGHLMEEDESDE
ncbi:Tumour suppressing sub-chromosomal transferable candidate 4 [Cinara cedri]|uniref:U5 small nuclear ribonucleoprotein TSSC4 n=1 Tax=Cinara cedri TaxID=506608 RepID=A0A5E4M6T3_9HEMI|nr:Tumour suppressing sub-chromosomal transferable candidate 4 [Cinara cedri]